MQRPSASQEVEQVSGVSVLSWPPGSSNSGRARPAARAASLRSKSSSRTRAVIRFASAAPSKEKNRAECGNDEVSLCVLISRRSMERLRPARRVAAPGVPSPPPLALRIK
jgi:hypothetical protein